MQLMIAVILALSVPHMLHSKCSRLCRIWGLFVFGAVLSRSEFRMELMAITVVSLFFAGYRYHKHRGDGPQ